MKHKIIVIADITERTDLQIAQVESEKMLSFREMTHLLVDGISLLIKLSKESGGMKDYELMDEVIEHINHNFVSTKAFEDGKIIIKDKKNETI